MNQLAKFVMSIFRSSKPHSLSTCAVVACIALQIADANAAVRFMDVCPMEKVTLDCSHLLEEAIKDREYEELIWSAFDPRMISGEQKLFYLAYCNGNVSCIKYSLESGFEDRVKVGNDPVNNGELSVQLLRINDYLSFVCEVITTKDQLAYKVNISSSVKCLTVFAGQDIELNQVLEKTHQKKNVHEPTDEFLQRECARTLSGCSSLPEYNPYFFSPDLTVFAGQDIELNQAQEIRYQMKNVQDIFWYWQQQKIVYCNLSMCVFVDCKSSCPQFRPRLVIKRKTILVLTRVEEGDRGLELQYRLFPKASAQIFEGLAPEIHNLKLDVLLPSAASPAPSPSSCGDRPSGYVQRIVGGKEAVKNSIPWQAMLRTPGSQFCGGSLIHKRWVLTAAHCVENVSPGSFQIWLGAHQKEVKEDTTQEFQVVKVVRNPQYNANGHTENDMALIKLDKEAVLGPGVGLVCLGNDSNHLPLDDLTNQCLISGWGTLKSGGDQPGKLYEVMVPLVSRSVCKKTYNNLHDSMLCAGFKEGGKDSCQGDSGGPLVCQYNNKWFVEGVTSFGKGCATPEAYGVYAKVRHLRSFIDKTIKEG